MQPLNNDKNWKYCYIGETDSAAKSVSLLHTAQSLFLRVNILTHAHIQTNACSCYNLTSEISYLNVKSWRPCVTWKLKSPSDGVDAEGEVYMQAAVKLMEISLCSHWLTMPTLISHPSLLRIPSPPPITNLFMQFLSLSSFLSIPPLLILPQPIIRSSPVT